MTGIFAGDRMRCKAPLWPDFLHRERSPLLSSASVPRPSEATCLVQSWAVWPTACSAAPLLQSRLRSQAVSAHTRVMPLNPGLSTLNLNPTP